MWIPCICLCTYWRCYIWVVFTAYAAWLGKQKVENQVRTSNSNPRSERSPFHSIHVIIWKHGNSQSLIPPCAKQDKFEHTLRVLTGLKKKSNVFLGLTNPDNRDQAAHLAQTWLHVLFIFLPYSGWSYCTFLLWRENSLLFDPQKIWPSFLF